MPAGQNHTGTTKMDTKTRCYSTHHMIELALHLKEALNRIIATEKNFYTVVLSLLTGRCWRTFVCYSVYSLTRPNVHPTLTYRPPYCAFPIGELQEYHESMEHLQHIWPVLLEAEVMARGDPAKYRDNISKLTNPKIAMPVDPGFKAHGFAQMG
jgi:hypothetical protein